MAPCTPSFAVAASVVLGRGASRENRWRRSTFKQKAAVGEFERHRLTDGTYGYYVYELLDWFLSR